MPFCLNCFSRLSRQTPFVRIDNNNDDDDAAVDAAAAVATFNDDDVDKINEDETQEHWQNPTT